MNIVCKNCKSTSIKKCGFTHNNKQRYCCMDCQKKFILDYTYNAYHSDIDEQIITLTKEGVGIRGTARILKISTTTLLARIIAIAKQIRIPAIKTNQKYELDELRTYIGNKENVIWVIYAINTQTKIPTSLKIGRRNKKNLKIVTDSLLLSNAKKIYTDKLPMYKTLIDTKIHSTKHRATNHIERYNLTLRTHLKRLNRKTLCFSKSLLVLAAIIKIYFWL